MSGSSRKRASQARVASIQIMIQDTRYVVITPVRDEEKYVEATVRSVTSQTILPAEWIIVNDGSSDRTGDIVDQYAVQFPWIHVIHRRNRGFRKSGGGVIDAFYDGYAALRHETGHAGKK